METREEKLATWTDPSTTQQQNLRILIGSIHIDKATSKIRARYSEDKIQFDQIEDSILKDADTDLGDADDSPRLWQLKIISLPRRKAGRLVLSMPKQTYMKIQEAWCLHPRTIEVFLSNNGVLTTSRDTDTGRTSLVWKVANSRATGFDCVSMTRDILRRTTYVLYHHLHDEEFVFSTLLSDPERCFDSHFFIAAVYRSHHQQIEFSRNKLDDMIQDIERQSGFGRPGRAVVPERPPSMDGYPELADPKRTIQQLSYCQTDLAGTALVARSCLECGHWLLQSIDQSLAGDATMKLDANFTSQQGQAILDKLKTIRLLVREDVEYTRRRTVMLLSQVQSVKDRTLSQTSFMLSDLTQSDAEYTAAIAVDGKRDSSAMKTLSILGIVYLPGTFVATLFSVGMFDWGVGDGSDPSSSLRTSSSMWIYWAVSIPLTLVTFLVWMLWSRKVDQESNERLMIYRGRSPASESGVLDASRVGSGLGEKMV